MAEKSARKVLFVAYYFPPRGGAGVQRSLKFVKYLRRFGWEPTVLTTTYESRAGAHDESLLAEVPEGTEIVEVPSRESLFVRMGSLGLGRLTGLTLRPDAMVTWARAALPVAHRLCREAPFDCVYTSVQPWSAGLVGLGLKRSLAVPWVSDFRDPWTESLHLEWPSRAHWLLDRKLEEVYLENADRTLVVTPTMKEEFLAGHPHIAPETIEVLYNGFDREDFEAPGGEDDGKFTIVFAGKFQYDHGRASSRETFRLRVRDLATFKPRNVRLDTHSPIYFFKALAEFLSRDEERRSRTRCIFAGSIGRGNMSLAGQLGLDEVVENRGYLPHRDAVRLVKSADALLLPMFSTDDPAERVAYASGKVFEYIAAGRPILALTQEGDARDLALASGLGVAAI